MNEYSKKKECCANCLWFDTEENGAMICTANDYEDYKQNQRLIVDLNSRCDSYEPVND